MSIIKLLISLSLIILSLNITAKEILDCAKKQIGKPYVSGGKDPKRGFDCTGLAYYCHKPLNIGYSPSAQASKNKIRVKDRKPGDLLFFACGGKGISHTVIYIGNDEFIEAPKPGMKVRRHKFTKYYCGGKIVSASRYWK